MGFNPFKSIDRVLDKGSNALQSAASSVRNEFNDTTRTIRRTTSSAVNTVRREIGETRQTVSRTARNAINTSRREIGEARQTVSRTARNAINTSRREIGETRQTVSRTARNAINTTRREIGETRQTVSTTARNAINTTRREIGETRQTVSRTARNVANTARQVNLSNVGHTVLDGAGFIPVVGGIADLANASWYAAKGDKVNAALSAASAIPFAGDAFAAGKLGLKAAKGAEKLAEAGTVAGRVAANVTDEVAEAVNVGGRNVAPAPSTLHTRGNRPDLAERTINGYVNRNVERAGGEITSLRPSGREINRAGQSGTHNIRDAHFHERYRDVAPDGTVREGITKKAVKAEERHVRELYKALDEGRTRTKKDR